MQRSIEVKDEKHQSVLANKFCDASKEEMQKMSCAVALLNDGKSLEELETLGYDAKEIEKARTQFFSQKIMEIQKIKHEQINTYVTILRSEIEDNRLPEEFIWLENPELRCKKILLAGISEDEAANMENKETEKAVDTLFEKYPNVLQAKDRIWFRFGTFESDIVSAAVDRFIKVHEIVLTFVSKINSAKTSENDFVWHVLTSSDKYQPYKDYLKFKSVVTYPVEYLKEAYEIIKQTQFKKAFKLSAMLSLFANASNHAEALNNASHGEEQGKCNVM